MTRGTSHRLNRSAHLALGLAVCGLATAAHADSGRHLTPRFEADVYGGYSSSEIMVKLREGVTFPQHADRNPGHRTVSGDVLVALELWNAGDAAPAASHNLRNVQAMKDLGLDRWYTISVPEGTDTLSMALYLSAFATEIEVAEIVGIGGTADFTPNDQHFGVLYGMHNTGQSILGQTGVVDADIDAPEAWGRFTGLPNSTVAVIDSGVNDHPDFTGRLMQGWNTVNLNTDTSDLCPHGTHCAGTVGAAGNNTEGVVGVNYAVNLLPVRVLTGCGGTTTQCADGILWATDNGADVGTMSLQYYTYSSYFEDSTEYAQVNDVVLIAANGNNAGRNVAWPAKFPWVVGVSATTNRDVRASWSNYGPECEVAAPGENVYSTWVGNSYTYLSGTSMAAPHTAGLASLIQSYRPELTAQEVRDVITSAVDDLGTSGWDEHFGYGRINADKALTQVAKSPMNLTLPTLNAGSNANLTVSGADANARVYFVYAVGALGNTHVPQLGIVCDLANPVLAGSSLADGSGNVSFTAFVPTAAAGRTVRTQALVAGNKSDVETQTVN